MIYNAIDVSYYIIYHEAQCNRAVSNLRLQKLLYFVQAQFIMNSPNGQPCFTQRMEAWDFGPVVPEVYRKYKYYGSAMIPWPNDNKTNFPELDRKLIDDMLDHCAKYSTPILVEIIHSQAPWRKAYYNMIDNIITSDSIRSYFNRAYSLYYAKPCKYHNIMI